MATMLEVLLSPAEFAPLAHRDLSQTTCVVIDVLRATSTMITALANGASAIIPVESIAEALAVRQRQPGVLLGGERHGLRIRAAVSGGVDFDLGNSPREYTAEKVAGKCIAVTTTNGTRALRACAKARAVMVGSLLNLRATTAVLEKNEPGHLMLVCSGTGEGPAWEDTLAAGALCDRLAASDRDVDFDDSAFVARELYRSAQAGLHTTLSCSRNARRLLAIPELRDDVAFCLEVDRFNFAAAVDGTGAVRKLTLPSG
jgi:2-phosphosulfolactate phosphatase